MSSASSQARRSQKFVFELLAADMPERRASVSSELDRWIDKVRTGAAAWLFV